MSSPREPNPDVSGGQEPIQHAWRVEGAHGRLQRLSPAGEAFESTTTPATGWLQIAGSATMLRHRSRARLTGPHDRPQPERWICARAECGMSGCPRTTAPDMDSRAAGRAHRDGVAVLVELARPAPLEAREPAGELPALRPELRPPVGRAAGSADPAPSSHGLMPRASASSLPGAASRWA